MAGIYIHVPFCRQRCYYCDFYTTTQLTKKNEVVRALNSELIQRKAWMVNTTIDTIYFGGGTPSLLSIDEIESIINTIYTNFKVAENPEITLEANPDDLSAKQLKLLANSPINRLSIGIQSFNDAHLKLMNRRHTSEQAIESVKDAQTQGFDNISVDLIYGLPDLSLKDWEYNLLETKKLNVQHLSAYHLTYEKGTVFDVWLKNKKIKAIKEQSSIDQFKMLIAWAKKNEFIHYEISNFGKEEYFSKHNTSYWMQKEYLGIGPSAHSYNINTRTWNVANLSKYVQLISDNKESYDTEILSEIDKYNEFLITSLRTRWGINLDILEKQFGNLYKEHLLTQSSSFIKQGEMYIKNNRLILSDEGVFVSDTVLADLMMLPED